MKYFAILKYARVSPLKARLVANTIKKFSASEAERVLKYMPNKSARLILKLLKSAIYNAKNKNAEVKNLVISEIKVDSGPSIKRRKIRSRGRADVIKKRTSHIIITLEEVKQKEAKANDKNKKSDKNLSRKVRNSKHEILNKSQITNSKKIKQKV